MLQPYERTPRAIRPVSDEALDRALPPAGSALALPSGEIAGDLRDRGVMRRTRALFELLVANNTPIPIAAYAYAAPNEAHEHQRVSWEAILVPPYSAVAVDLEIPLLPDRSRPRVVAHVLTHDAELTLDAKAAPPPSRSKPIQRARRPFAIAAALALAVLAPIGYFAMHPRVALAAPDTVREGAAFYVAYSAYAAESAEYRVATPDGHEVVSGALAPGSSSFSIALPATTHSQGYDVSVAARGRLGEDVRTVHVLAVPVPPETPTVAVTVSSLKLASTTVDAGKPVVASYRSTVTTGTVRLIDQYGTVRAEAVLSPRGRTTLAAPYVDADQDMRVVVTAQHGTSTAQAVVPVTVHHVDVAQLPGSPVLVPGVGADGNVQPPAQAAAPPETGGNPRELDPSDPNALGEQTVVTSPGPPPISVDASQIAGHAVAVHVLKHYPGLKIALMGPGGDELVSSNVSAGESTVLLAPPDLAAGAPRSGYSVVATFNHGFGEETLIRPIAFR